ncbi:MAG TPA: NAD(P)H-quinone oxidoreductase [Vicinamibacterales bacterium]
MSAIPAHGTVVRITRPGGPGVLVPEQAPVPSPGRGELLIQVHAAGVNRPDLAQRQGRYLPPPGAPEIPGLEVAGRVVAVGPGTERFAIGDVVCALVSGGGYAEYCVAPAVQCLPLPEGVSAIEAAALPETCFTVWTNVFERGRLRSGESLLVHGGASGIGTTAIQIARARGAVVFATAGTEAKCEACERLGAIRAINYRTEDFVAIVRELTDGRGVDVVLDMVGGSYVARNIEALAFEGRLVQIALLEGSRVELDIAPVMRRHLTFTGSLLRPRSVAEKGRLAREVEREVWPLIARGEVRPVIHATFPLEQAAAAHAALEEGAHVGKIVLTTRALTPPRAA